MWVCPKCGRKFEKTNQGHYCGEAPKTVLEYIEAQSLEAHSHLKNMVAIIRDSVPDANERISWSMPFYEKAGKSVSFSACKNHISLYVGIDAIEKFASELNGFSTKKNAIYLPYNKMLPSKLIEDIIKWCLM
ncbi:iron chaperone [Frisingicoccus sp.]|uniref:iron chaperone n=1 Tax=Frisingicoccus sp. TaxID=1918627 RepID=UPI003AB3D3EC